MAKDSKMHRHMYHILNSWIHTALNGSSRIAHTIRICKLGMYFDSMYLFALIEELLKHVLK